MGKFQPRLSSDGLRSSPYYGKYNYYDTPSSNSNGNCTWYAYGRFREIQSEVGTTSGSSTKAPQNPSTNYHNPGDNNAGRWRFSVTPGLATGDEPELGAVLVIYDPSQPQHSTSAERRSWQNVSWRPGHVCVVERKNSDGSWTISESGYASNGKGFFFRTKTMRKYSGKGWLPEWCHTARPSYKQWKFIYNPAIHGSSQGNSATGTGGTASDPEPTAANYIRWIYKRKQDMTEPDMVNNGKYVYLYLRNKGWKIKPICAVLGYMQWHSKFSCVFLIGESELHVSGGLRPDDEGQGYGLLTWSPSRALIDFLEDNNYQIGMVANSQGLIKNYDFEHENDAYGQLEFFDDHTMETIEWTPRPGSEYYESFDTFKTDVYSRTQHSTSWLANCFSDSWVGLDLYITDNSKLIIADYAKQWETLIRGSEIAGVYSIAPGNGSTDDDDESPQPSYPYYNDEFAADDPFLKLGNYKNPENKHMIIARRRVY